MLWSLTQHTHTQAEIMNYYFTFLIRIELLLFSQYAIYKEPTKYFQSIQRRSTTEIHINCYFLSDGQRYIFVRQSHSKMFTLIQIEIRLQHCLHGICWLTHKQKSAALESRMCSINKSSFLFLSGESFEHWVDIFGSLAWYSYLMPD